MLAETKLRELKGGHKLRNSWSVNWLVGRPHFLVVEGLECEKGNWKKVTRAVVITSIVKFLLKGNLLPKMWNFYALLLFSPFFFFN